MIVVGIVFIMRAIILRAQRFIFRPSNPSIIACPAIMAVVENVSLGARSVIPNTVTAAGPLRIRESDETHS